MEEERTMKMEGGESKTLIILKTIPVYPISMSADELSVALGMSRADVNSRIRKCSTNYLFAELKTAGKSIIYCYPDEHCKQKTIDYALKAIRQV